MSLVTSSPAKKTKWNAADYAAHSVIQQTWARELIAQLKLRGDEHILDVGCGDGKVTAELARAVPRGAVVGVDASAEMIRYARKTFRPSQISNLKFEIADARKLQNVGQASRLPSQRVSVGLSKTSPSASPSQAGETPALLFDILFSNAALHWVDDHQAFLRCAAAALKTDGRLVVSCGGKGNAHDVFLALRPEMRLARWRQFFRRMPKPYFFFAPEDYEKWLPRSGFKTRRIQLAPKDATYAGADGFATWLRTTWLPYTQRVPENLREEFIAAVTERYLAKHPVDKAGQVHVRMVRLEIDAVKI